MFFFNHYFSQGCSRSINITFGEINFNVTSSYYVRCNWNIKSAGISQAVALISVQELDLDYCR